MHSHRPVESYADGEVEVALATLVCRDVYHHELAAIQYEPSIVCRADGMSHVPN
jgi:hypothetical protein